MAETHVVTFHSLIAHLIIILLGPVRFSGNGSLVWSDTKVCGVMIYAKLGR
jgi:hypothetical protein